MSLTDWGVMPWLNVGVKGSVGRPTWWTDVVAFVEHWQVLIGAFLGVLAAVLSAIVIVFLTRSQKRRSAAHVVYFDLKRYMQVISAAREAARGSEDYRKAREEDSPLTPEQIEASILFRNRPPLSNVFQESLGDLASADVELALELSVFQSFHDAAEKMLGLAEEIENRLLLGKGDYEPPASLTGYLNSGLKQTESAIERADYITKLIAQLYRGGLIKSPARRLYRAMRYKKILEKKSQQKRSSCEKEPSASGRERAEGE